MHPIKHVHKMIIAGMVLDRNGSWISLSDALRKKQDEMKHVFAGEIRVQGEWVPLSGADSLPETPQITGDDNIKEFLSPPASERGLPEDREQSPLTRHLPSRSGKRTDTTPPQSRVSEFRQDPPGSHPEKPAAERTPPEPPLRWPDPQKPEETIHRAPEPQTAGPFSRREENPPFEHTDDVEELLPPPEPPSFSEKERRHDEPVEQPSPRMFFSLQQTDEGIAAGTVSKPASQPGPEPTGSQPEKPANDDSPPAESSQTEETVSRTPGHPFEKEPGSRVEPQVPSGQEKWDGEQRKQPDMSRYHSPRPRTDRPAAEEAEPSGASSPETVTIRSIPLGKETTLTISETRAGSALVAVCSLQGFLDQTNSDEFHSQLISMLDFGVRYFIIDLEHTTLVGSAGWGVLAVVARLIRASDGRLLVCAMRKEIEENFYLMQFNEVIDARNTIIDCLEVLRTAGGEREDPGADDRKNAVTTLYEDNFSELPLPEKVKTIIAQHGPISFFQIHHYLKQDLYGNVSINPLKLFHLLRELNLDTRWKRLRFYRSC